MADCLVVDEDIQELVLDDRNGARTSMELLANEEFDVLHALVSAVQHNVDGTHLTHIDFPLVFLYENRIAFNCTKKMGQCIQQI